MRLLAALLAPAALVLAACGTEDASTPDEPSAATSLSVTVLPDGEEDGPREEWTLSCGPAGGSHPEAEAACALLDGLDDSAFAPVPADAICTEIFGGPHRARVSGEWRGRPLDAEFSRHNGCEIARWDRLVPLLPSAA